MAPPPNVCLVHVLRTLCDDAFFAIASTARLDGDMLRSLAKRRAPVIQSTARGARPDLLDQWDGWIEHLSVAIAPIQPPRWLAMAGVVDEGLSLEHGARGVRSLFTSKPSEKDIARVRSFGAFVSRALASVLGATGTFNTEARSQRGCFVASLGLPEEEHRALAAEEPVPADKLEVPEGLPPRLARAVLRGAFFAAMLEGVDPREEQAVMTIGKKTGLAPEEITAAHSDARGRIEAARAFGGPAVDAIRYVLEGDKEVSDKLAVAAARLTLPMNHRTEAITAVNVGGKVVLAKKWPVDKRQRDAVLGLAWIAALRSDPSLVQRIALAARHDAVAADLGDDDAGRDARRTIELFLDEELGAVVPLVPQPMS
ncbi:hypothetical protein [Polyangium aurulentum]|uniref:hypothetical protein n=1 Tax=Polyangium aurulentum TaxID=2567896 RepID=UPI0010AE6446|nr:hypothetical protein [Polyangium aurulentum]UQA62867.1 hypothetical protein E8A73_021400 [Polyangium aurulentum]